MWEREGAVKSVGERGSSEEWGREGAVKSEGREREQ